MADLVLTSFTVTGTFLEVVSGIEVELETVDTAKTRVSTGIIPLGNRWYGWTIYET